ncbi:MAG: hypothetical protein ICV53_23880 [Flavisolibacter sp.]|nr:hypothetical protein [Flavisolibacter sp.]
MYASYTTKLTTALLLITITFSYCTKDSDRLRTQTRELSVETYETLIKLNQVIVLADRTDLKDSIDFVVPPTDKRYEWIIAPNNGCAEVKGGYNPFGRIVFTCPGTYQISANVYDSLTNKLIAQTNTVEVKVVADTLYPVQAIALDDVLNMRPGLVKSWMHPHNSSTSPPDEVYISLALITTKPYEYNSAYNQLVYTSAVGANDYSYIFTDSIKLVSYPFAYGYGKKYPVDAWIDIKGLNVGTPAGIRIRWLGKTYSGTVTLINNDQYTFEWDNSGAVKVK